MKWQLVIPVGLLLTVAFLPLAATAGDGEPVPAAAGLAEAPPTVPGPDLLAAAQFSSPPDKNKTRENVKKRLEWKSKRNDKTGGLRLRDLSFRPNPHLGLAFPGNLVKYYKVISDAGIGVIRLSCPWSAREPQRGQYDWSGLDERILTLNGLGIEVFLTLDSDAPWGVESTTVGARNRPPLDMAVWQEFVSRTVERYDADGVDDAPGLKTPTRYFQVANEWIGENNKSGGWSGTQDQLIALFNASYDAVKKACPEAKFVLGGIAAINLDIMVLTTGLDDYTAVAGYEPDSDVVLTSALQNDPEAQAYTQDAIRVLAATRYDYADLHLYGPVDFLDSRLTMVRQEVGSKPLLSSECGGPSRAYEETITPEDHFMSVMDYNLHGLSRGLQFLLWLRLGEGETGVTWGNMEVPLFDLDRQPKGGYWAYMLLAAILDDFKDITRESDGVYVVRRNDGPVIYVLWATPGRTTYQLPAGAAPRSMIQVTDAVQGVYEIRTPPTDGLLQLGPLPLVISEKLPGGAYVEGQTPDLTPVDAPGTRR